MKTGTLVNKVILAAVLLMLVLMGVILWFVAVNTPDETVDEIDPLEAIIHDQMYHQDSEETQNPNSILEQFKRRTPLPDQE
jgi:type IV secretory pathway TrbD component